MNKFDQELINIFTRRFEKRSANASELEGWCNDIGKRLDKLDNDMESVASKFSKHLEKHATDIEKSL
ncbi:hypothetical protein EJF36_06385 [Bacillus sp. HMF5848]|uniref:hypothetical protein n=1 Tax=Bacillus sp. HMF5848 TaxID=2495421 RepID=UPI000F776A69|nr:hypothetical protein [Bacillus sp. HMF5848]RSK26517.1 hypothetical protein EJF36_06385 [Bacillus sp. HMF5848]